MKRIISIDVLRGIAVLGILIMNIQSFSMPSAAYINPTAYGDLTGINRWVWIFSHILASEKFMSIFSMLFGAGMVIFAENAERKGRNPALLHYRRMGWLLLFGLLHGYLLWYGDILVSYSLCGMLLFLFRKLPPQRLIWIGFGFYLVPVILDSLFAFSMPFWPEESVYSTLQSWKPDDETIRHYLDGYRGGWLGQMELRVHGTLFLQTGYFMMQSFWRVFSMMLMGMALYRWRVLSAERSTSFYLRMTLTGLVAGYALSGLGVVLNFREQWSMEWSMFLGTHLNYVGSVGVALGYTGLIMLICKWSGMPRFKSLFASVGRMAFTNYILTTLLCTSIFYGHGFGLYGSVERVFQLLIVLGVWILLMVISPLWLKRFRYGPLEAVWRKLTYYTI
ncbi:MAG: DUF418 domain-containing protein [Bacteroidota bacterium]